MNSEVSILPKQNYITLISASIFKDRKSKKIHYKRESFLTDFSSQKNNVYIGIEKRIIWLLELQKGKFKTREVLASAWS